MTNLLNSVPIFSHKVQEGVFKISYINIHEVGDKRLENDGNLRSLMCQGEQETYQSFSSKPSSLSRQHGVYQLRGRNSVQLDSIAFFTFFFKTYLWEDDIYAFTIFVESWVCSLSIQGVFLWPALFQALQAPGPDILEFISKSVVYLVSYFMTAVVSYKINYNPY